MDVNGRVRFLLGKWLKRLPCVWQADGWQGAMVVMDKAVDERIMSDQATSSGTPSASADATGDPRASSSSTTLAPNADIALL